MDQVDREASTKEEEGIVNQECVTVESTNGMEYFDRFSQISHCNDPVMCIQALITVKQLEGSTWLKVLTSFWPTDNQFTR